jgi:hypothetical protein
MPRLRVTLAQLPIPQPAALSPTGNVPLAAGALAVAARVHGLSDSLEVDILPTSATDRLGDARLADEIAARSPDLLGLSLYLWNVERSLHLAREVKRRAPNTRVVIGGPEVSADNPFVLAQEGYDLAVTGEAEETFVSLMQALAGGRSAQGLPGVAVRSGDGMTSFAHAEAAHFALGGYPSPYLQDVLPVETERSIYVETVRGCRSHCTFCFYPRSSSVLRTLGVPESAALIRTLKERGAREVVFLDPTFNHRPEFAELLAALAAVNADRALSFFAEVRAEGLTEAHAEALARAGFTKLEIGLQSVNPEALRATRRGGSGALVAQAARLLHAHGIRLLVDLIVGLPGDGAEHVMQGIDFLLEHGLEREAQIFPLAVLPGTAMRASAARDGVTFEPAPPYHVRRTRTLPEDEIAACLFAAEDRLGRRVDEYPRPHLVDGADPLDPPDVFRLDVDGDTTDLLESAARPGARHTAVWFAGRDLYAARELLAAAIGRRARVDPYATLDVVLAPRASFPLDLIDWLRLRLDGLPASYASRSLAWRGENAQRRIAVVLPRGAALPADYLALLMDRVSLFQDQSLESAARDAERLGNELPAARVIAAPLEVAPETWLDLAQRADPEAVAFAERRLEARWIRTVLGHGEIAGAD